MPENLMIPKHKSSNPAFREGWDRTFGFHNAVVFIDTNNNVFINERLAEKHIVGWKKISQPIQELRK